MVWHLFTDLVRRQRMPFFIWTPLIGWMWAQAARGETPIGMAAALSVGIGGLMICPHALSAAGPVEVRVRPVTTRELWLAAWLSVNVAFTAVLVTIAAVAAGTVFAITGASQVSPATVLKCAALSVAVTGFVLPVTGLAPVSAQLDRSRSSHYWLAVQLLAMGLMGLVTIGTPYYLWTRPAAIEQPTTVTLILLALGWTFAIGSLAWTPHRFSLAGRYAGVAGVGRNQPLPRPDPGGPDLHLHRHRHFAERFTGLWRVAWTHVRVVTLFTLLAVAAATVMAWWRADQLRDGEFVFVVSAVFAFMMFALWNPWTPWVRLLKVLPIAAGNINLILVATPFVTWSLVALLLVGINAASGQALPRAPLIELFAAAAALTALGQAVSLRLGAGPIRSSVGPIAMILSPAFLAAAFLDRVGPDRISAVLLGAAMLLVVAAALVNHRTLTRSGSASRVYRPLGARPESG